MKIGNAAAFPVLPGSGGARPPDGVKGQSALAAGGILSALKA
ncbi:hypothetical protein WCP94_002602 [Bilophila wadsworthia]